MLFSFDVKGRTQLKGASYPNRFRTYYDTKMRHCTFEPLAEPAQ